jgi:hypothetical protein
MPNLLHCLLHSETGKAHHEIAKELGISASSLSRHSTGLLSKKSVLAKLAHYYSERIGTAVDADALITEVEPKTLVATVLVLRSKRLTKGSTQ